ncbi:hypothetical protein KXQ82_08640 [Mucilaginibacter sp. HMF5004]|uniref:hypothetical protein n=1 Tax=Mucilaginibacter rivuli TaxID=2857527 RepID=UPI001C5FB5C4|nr:hypothetical protein [Mucilaginibacter rivuli]MBW4889781.1 hypothetical protein [Mucilaginibacter rivuli]
MNLRTPLFQLLTLLTLIFTLPGCESSQPPGIYQNDKINSSTRDKIHQLDDQLFAAAKDGKLQDIEALMAKEMLENNDYKRTADQIGNNTKSGKYTLLDEYYIHNTNPGHNDEIKPANKAYKLGYHSVTSESYLSLMLLENGDDKWLLNVAYSKLDYGWKITSLDIGHYSINGKNAPELLAFANEQYKKGYLVNAVNNMELATKCLRPSQIWEYPNEKQIGDYYSLVSAEAYQKFKFPILIPIPSKPQIFRIMTQTQKGGGYVPTVKYVTKVDVRDTVALKQEFEGVKKAIGQALPGIDHDNKLIIFSAYNERPTGNTNPFSFDMVYKLK